MRSKITPGSSAGAGNSESASSRGQKYVNIPETHVMIVMLQVLKWRRLTTVYDQSEQLLHEFSPGG